MDAKNEDDLRYTVYKHTSPSGKSYIGITSMNPKARWKNGKGYGNNKYFTHAIEKYGWDNFTHEIIAEGLTKEEAQKMEVELIKKYDTFDSEHGYNLTSGGEVGKQHTEEARRKQSELAKRLWQDEAFRELHADFLYAPRNGKLNPNYGNHALAGENHPFYGKKRSKETIEKMRQAARNMSEETKKKMSESAKKRFEDPALREYYRQLATGRHPSDKARKKMSESQYARWNDDLRKEYSQRFSGEGNPMYGRHHSEETKQKLREMFSGENSPLFGTHHSEETKKLMHDVSPLKVPVVRLDLNGNYIDEFDSYSYAAKEVGGEAPAIIGCCNGREKSAYGFMWVKKDEYDPHKKYIYTNNNRKPVVQLTLDREFVAEYESADKAHSETGVFSQNIGRSCKSQGKYTAKGFRWMYKEDYVNSQKKEKGE